MAPARIAFGLIAATLWAGAACAQAPAKSVEEFYKGTNIMVLVGSGAGGGYDVYTRVLIRTMGKYIPGHPRLLVQNMPGADSIISMNHLATISPRDGSVIAAPYNTAPLDALFGGQASHYDPLQLGWIGSIGKQVNVCLAWGQSSFKTLDDLMQREMRVGATGAQGWRSILPRLSNAVAGSKLKVIEGYETSDMIPAVERGEIDGLCTTYETMLATAPDWIAKHKIVFLAQFGFQPIPELKGVAMGLERIKNLDDLAAVRLILLQQEFGRPYVAPPDVPPERLAALRKAFDATMKDPDFIADARKTGVNIEPLGGAGIEASLNSAYAAPAPVLDRARAILRRATTGAP